ncbi:MAG TPA: CoA-binding protein [Azospirillaceae bacterium]|nr:CoA-binding protein [Azospirillaceae bacterium]
MRDLNAFFHPRRVAVVGAGERPTSSGGAVMRNLARAGFTGEIVPVNHHGSTLFDRPAAVSLKDLGTPADLVVVAVKPEAVPEVVDAAAASGHKNLLILPGGFAESGPEGMERERRVLEAANRAGITIAGPNAAGIIRLSSRQRFAATFLRELPPGGGIAVVSQSGALAEEVVARAQSTPLPVGTVVSVGNALHLGIEDYVEYLGHDPEVSAILLYFESVNDLERFLVIARAITREKPVVALVPGRSEPGRRAASAHTSSISMMPETADAFLEQAGIIRAYTLRELLLAARGLEHHPRGIGRRVLILSNAGGPAVLTADACAIRGLELPPLPGPLAAALRSNLPAEASVANPIDLPADAREDRFGFALEQALRLGREAFDAILMVHVVPFMVDEEPVVHRLAELARGAGMPVLHTMMGAVPRRAEWARRLADAGVALFDNVEDSAVTASLLARHRVLQERLGQRFGQTPLPPGERVG